MTTYKSKIGLGLVIPLAVLLGGLGLFMAYGKNWGPLLTLVVVGFFITHLFMTTYYQIDGNRLKIRSGFLVNKSLEISSIRKITKTRNPISSPATSLDRLEISYNKFDSVLVSPKDQIGFVRELERLNPDIVVKL